MGKAATHRLHRARATRGCTRWDHLERFYGHMRVQSVWWGTSHRGRNPPFAHDAHISAKNHFVLSGALLSHDARPAL